MRARTLILLAFAVIAAGGTFFLAQNWIAAQRGALNHVATQKAPEPQPAVLVLVASQELSAGQFIKAKDLRWQPWPKKGLADSYFIKGGKRADPIKTDAAKNSAKNKQTAENRGPSRGVIEDFLGAVVRSKIMPGEPITEGRVVRPGERGFLAAVLKPDMRAISVPINATTGISGFVFPGDKVDLLLTHTIKQDQDGKKSMVRRATETVLTDIRVLAVDQRTDDIEGKPVIAKTATLEVTPKQAEVIAVVSEMGRLSLSLRSLATKDEGLKLAHNRRTYTWDTEASYLIPRKKSDANKYVVKVIRGGTATASKFAKSRGGSYSATSEPKTEESKTGLPNAGAMNSGVTNIQPAAAQTATAGPRNLLGKVN